QRADRAAAETQPDAWFRADVPPGDPSWGRAEGDLATSPPEPSRLRAAVGLGRDELDRTQDARRFGIKGFIRKQGTHWLQFRRDHDLRLHPVAVATHVIPILRLSDRLLPSRVARWT